MGDGEAVWALRDVVFRARAVGEEVGEAGVQDSPVLLRQPPRKLVIGTQVTQEMLPWGALGGMRQPWELLLCKRQSSAPSS